VGSGGGGESGDRSECEEKKAVKATMFLLLEIEF
jgi:hypothetical protein